MPLLDEAMRRRADRGTPVGVDVMIARVAAELHGGEAPQVVALRHHQIGEWTPLQLRDSDR